MQHSEASKDSKARHISQPWPRCRPRYHPRTTWRPDGLLLARANSRSPFSSPGVQTPFRWSGEMALGFFLEEFNDIQRLRLRPSSHEENRAPRLPRSPLSSPRPTDGLPRGHACVGIPAEKKKSTRMMRSPKSPYAKAVLLSYLPFRAGVSHRGLLGGRRKGRETCWVLAYALLGPNSPAGPSPSPRPVFRSMGPRI